MLSSGPFDFVFLVAEARRQTNFLGSRGKEEHA